MKHTCKGPEATCDCGTERHALNVILFVYGTLKRGYGNHRLLEGAEFLGEDHAPGSVYGSGGAPIMCPDDGHWVAGEIYRVTSEEMLARIDRLEGHYPPDPSRSAYTRTPVVLRSGVKAEAYYWLRERGHWWGPRIESGEWTR